MERCFSSGSEDEIALSVSPPHHAISELKGQLFWVSVARVAKLSLAYYSFREATSRNESAAATRLIFGSMGPGL